MRTSTTTTLVVLLALALMRDAYAGQLLLKHYDIGSDCSTYFSGDLATSSETDAIGVCSNELGSSDVYFKATFANNIVSYTTYTNSTCSAGQTGSTTCACDTCCSLGASYSHDVKIDCSKANIELTKSITTSLLSGSTCSSPGIVESTFTGQVDTCEKSSAETRWHRFDLSNNGNSVTLTAYPSDDATGCTGSSTTSTCGCSDTCCSHDNGDGTTTLYKVNCPPPSNISSSTAPIFSVMVFASAVFMMAVSSI